ncbi:MAG TPA: bile acid:sodium symporter family protein [Paludibacteraceae bacterium]|jgi:BASS family bile acid:Na+ symporter|nr:bile acid:sodium symporter family protein [Paludibacteraceae bacterium]HPO48397.1 bile acid:sodium symporter family protein [Paludibacteraceae bacterium]HQC04444.1 bile acid:sodium symporter family protein [Paludibacteraceae bacterium]
MTMYEQLSQLDAIPINFSAAGQHAINIVLAFVMFGVALGIKPSEFKNVFLRPKSAIVGLFSQLVGLPLVTFLLILVLRNHITPMVAMGMILVAACPGGNISNFMTQFAKGNTELSVSLTAVTTSLAVLLTPANFALWGGLYVNYVNPEASMALRELHINVWQMFETVFILLGIPLTLGILTSHYLPKVAEKLHKKMQLFSLAFFVLMVLLAFGSNLELFIKYIWYIFFIVLVHNLLALSTGFSLGSLFRLPKNDIKTITIETGIQNSGLGLVLLFNDKIFPPELAIGGMLFVTAWWGVWHIISGLTVASLFRKFSKK